MSMSFLILLLLVAYQYSDKTNFCYFFIQILQYDYEMKVFQFELPVQLRYIGLKKSMILYLGYRS